jgi:hypothetical protein
MQALWINLPVHWGFGQGAGQLSFCGPRSINMAFALKIVGKFKDEIDVATKHAADKKQLTNYLDRLPKVLSGGEASARSYRTLNRSRPQGLSV